MYVQNSNVSPSLGKGLSMDLKHGIKRGLACGIALLCVDFHLAYAHGLSPVPGAYAHGLSLGLGEKVQPQQREQTDSFMNARLEDFLKNKFQCQNGDGFQQQFEFLECLDPEKEQARLRTSDLEEQVQQAAKEAADARKRAEALAKQQQQAEEALAKRQAEEALAKKQEQEALEPKESFVWRNLRDLAAAVALAAISVALLVVVTGVLSTSPLSGGLDFLFPPFAIVTKLLFEYLGGATGASILSVASSFCCLKQWRRC